MLRSETAWKMDPSPARERLPRDGKPSKDKDDRLLEWPKRVVSDERG